MVNKKKIFIIIGVVVIVIIAGWYLWVSNMKRVDQKNVVINNTINSKISKNALPQEKLDINNGIQKTTKSAQTATTKEKDIIKIKNVANFFVSMLGTYSSDANFQNIIDLKPMMTNSMKNWADSFIDRNLDNSKQSDERVQTKVFNVEIMDYTENRVLVLVNTRREKDSQGEVKTYNQNVDVYLIKNGDEWLVDKVDWK